MTSTISSVGQGSVPPSTASARATGRQLAHDASAPLLASGIRSVESLVRAGVPRLAELGVRVEIVRSRRNCVVVRSDSRPGAEAEHGCALVTAWLETLPHLAHKVPGSVVESSCVTRGGARCIHTLLWQVRRLSAAAPGPAAAAPGPAAAAPGPAAAAPGPAVRPVAAAAPGVATSPAAPAPAPGPAPSAPPAPDATPAPAVTPTPVSMATPAAPAPAAPAGPAPTPDGPPAIAPPAIAPPAVAPPAAAATTPAPTSPRSPVPEAALASDPTPADHRPGVGHCEPTDGTPPVEDPAPDPSSAPAAPFAAPADSWVQRANHAFRAAVRASGRTDATGPEAALPVPAPSDDHRAVPGSESAAVVVRDRRRSTAGPPVATTERPAAEPAPHPGGAGTAVPAHVQGGAPGSKWAWLRRRGWMIAVGLIAGAGGGYVAASHASPTYSATTVLVVRSGASTTGPGSANDASTLAVTDAALLGSDQPVIAQVARDLQLPVTAVGKGLTVQAVAGTSLMDVHFSASSPTVAMAGAKDVAEVLIQGRVANQAIPSASLAVVSLPKSATASGSKLKKGLPLGGLLGLFLGAGAAMTAERVDRRVDDPGMLAAATEAPVTVVPGGISPTELARSLARAAGTAPVALVPLRQAQVSAAHQLARELGGAKVPAGRGASSPYSVTSPFADAPDAASTGDGPTVLVVGAGERVRSVNEVAGRLALVGRRPVWSVLVTGR